MSGDYEKIHIFNIVTAVPFFYRLRLEYTGLDNPEKQTPA